MTAWRTGLGVVLGLTCFTVLAAAQAPDAGEDRRVGIDEQFALAGTVEGRSPLVFWVADGNGRYEDMLVRYHGGGETSGVGPLRMADGRTLGWPGDLVMIGDRVHGVDVSKRRVYVVDLDTGRCLPVTPPLGGRWKTVQSLAYDPGQERLFAFDHVHGQLIAIELGTGAVTQISAPELNGRRSVRSLAFDPDLGLVFAVDSDTELLLVVEPDMGLLAGKMALPLPPDSQLEELQVFKGQLYGLLGYKEQGELVAGQLLRINTKTGGISEVGERIEDVSPHALLIESMPERIAWRQVSGPADADLEYTSVLTSAVSFPEPGAYTFELTVYTAAGKLRDRVTIEAVATDCNANGIHDPEEIARGSALDRNENGVPDACELARGFVLELDARVGSAAGADGSWVALRVAPSPARPPGTRTATGTVQWAWLSGAVLYAARTTPFAGTSLADASRYGLFDPRTFHPRLDRDGRGPMDGHLVGAELALGLWQRTAWQDCAGAGARDETGLRALRLAISL